MHQEEQFQAFYLSTSPVDAADEDVDNTDASSSKLGDVNPASSAVSESSCDADQKTAQKKRKRKRYKAQPLQVPENHPLRCTVVDDVQFVVCS